MNRRLALGIACLKVASACNDAQLVGESAAAGGKGGGTGSATQPQASGGNGGASQVQPVDGNGGASQVQPVDGNGGTSQVQPVGGNGGASQVQPVGGNGGASRTAPMTMPAQCQNNGKTLTEPQAVTFELVSTGSETRYFRSFCYPMVQLFSCADDYVKPLSHFRTCPNNICGDPLSKSVACGTCDAGPVTITANEASTFVWSGNLYGVGEAGCSFDYQAPAGKYRAVVTVFANSDDALGDGISPMTTGVDFDYPDDDGIVRIEF